MNYATKRSKALYQRALRVLVEGGSSPSRGPANYGEHPIFLERGQGAYVYDADGNRYVDWMMAYGALPLGHAHPAVAAAIEEAAKAGTLFAAATEVEVEVAEMLAAVIPGAERVRFANTGTEAAMAAIRLARGYTGRAKFIKFEGHYHGWYDDFLLNAHPQPIASLGHRRDPIRIPDSSGLNRRALEDTIVVPWNDLQAVARALEDHHGQVAAVITEGVMGNMGVIPPADGFLAGLRALTLEHDVLLIMDETVTGFRVAPGGCQELFGVTADIATFGKALGAGLPVAAFTGKAEIMEALAWGGVLHYGTQNASRAGLFATRASLRELLRDDGAAFTRMRVLAQALSDGLRQLFGAMGVPAIVQHVGPMLQIFFTDRPAIRDYRDFCAHVDREKYRRFVWALFRHGVYMTPSAALHSIVTVAHTQEHVEETLRAARRALGEMEDE